MFRGRVVAEGEPQWTDLDRGYALAWLAEQNSKHECGQPLAEVFAKEHQNDYGAEVVRCHACAALERAMSEYGKADGADTAGLRARLTRTPSD